MLITVTHLDKKQYNDFKKLKKICYKHDKSVPQSYPHIMTAPRTMPTHILQYHKNELIGFIGIYFFQEDTAEMTLMIHPTYRRKKLATTFFTSLVPLLMRYGTKKLIFSSPISFHDVWCRYPQYTLDHKEHRMRYFFDNVQSIKPSTLTLHFDIADLSHISDLHLIDKDCFKRCHPENEERLAGMINTPKYAIFRAILDNTLIGKAHLSWAEEEAVLSDIGIFKQFQGKGYGRDLIKYVLDYAYHVLGIRKIALDVEADNDKALRLYHTLGFTISNTAEYWHWDYLTFPLK
jgi:RimJ/RimL family protein N-acetyltransferase